MSIPRAALWARLRQFIGEHYRELDVDLVLQVTWDIALINATYACQIAGQRSDWRGLPPDKSLFPTAPGCGLPIALRPGLAAGLISPRALQWVRLRVQNKKSQPLVICLL